MDTSGFGNMSCAGDNTNVTSTSTHVTRVI